MGNGHFMARKDEAYLHDIPLDEAKRRFDQALEATAWRRLGMEEIELNEQAIGRVTAAPVWAKISSPTITRLPWTVSPSTPHHPGRHADCTGRSSGAGCWPTSIPVIHYLNGPMWLCQTRMWNLSTGRKAR